MSSEKSSLFTFLRSDRQLTLVTVGTTPNAIELSRTTKLKYITFRCESLSSGWMTMTLGTITSEHRNLHQISIHIPYALSHATAQECTAIERQIENMDPGTRWSDLDHRLVELWESRSVRGRVVYHRTQTRDGGRGSRDWATYLFPELTKRGIIDLVEER